MKKVRMSLEKQKEYAWRTMMKMKRWFDQDGRCFYCQERVLPTPDASHAEHKIPLSRSGSDGPWNIVCACKNCNLRKGRQTAYEFTSQLSLLEGVKEAEGLF